MKATRKAGRKSVLPPQSPQRLNVIPASAVDGTCTAAVAISDSPSHGLLASQAHGAAAAGMAHLPFRRPMVRIRSRRQTRTAIAGRVTASAMR